VRARLNLTFYF